MKLLCYEQTIRYLVELDETEVRKLRDAGRFPPTGPCAVRLPLTLHEVDELLDLLGYQGDRRKLFLGCPAGRVRLAMDPRRDDGN